MRSWVIGGAAVALICLSACAKPANRADDAAAAGDGWNLFGPRHGRFVGLGIYNPQDPWTKMVDAAEQKDPRAAKTIDDQAVFVVVDSATGEIRACGDLTGYCIGMNPWKKPLTAAQQVPILLTEHVKPATETIKVTSKPAAPAAAAAGQASPPAPAVQ